MDNNDQIRQYLTSCGIGKAMWKPRLPDFTGGDKLRAFITSDDFDIALSQGRHFLFADKDPIEKFWAFSKEVALLQKFSLHTLSVRGLLSVLQDGNSRLYPKLVNCDLLCLRGLHAPNYTASPFTYPERNLVEEFLWYRVESLKSFAFTLPSGLMQAKWWSPDLMEKLNSNLADMYGGTDNTN